MITRRLIATALAVLTLAGGGAGPALAAAAPAGPPPPVKREVISVTRTSRTGVAVLALAGTVRADRRPGFFAVVDRDANGAALQQLNDFGPLLGTVKYGHGASGPLCNAPVICSESRDGTKLKFSLTIIDDPEDGRAAWWGVTRYFALEGTGIEITHAEVGFRVTRDAPATFARVVADQADTDGVGVDGTNAEVFRAAALPGGAHGSLAVLQLPCEVAGVGAVTFAATGDLAPDAAVCSGTDHNLSAGAHGAYVGGGGEQPGLFERSSTTATHWQVSGAVTGVTNTVTRLFVLSF